MKMLTALMSMLWTQVSLRITDDILLSILISGSIKCFVSNLLQRRGVSCSPISSLPLDSRGRKSVLQPIFPS